MQPVPHEGVAELHIFLIGRVPNSSIVVVSAERRLDPAGDGFPPASTDPASLFTFYRA